jgi:hypothetical protein
MCLANVKKESARTMSMKRGLIASIGCAVMSALDAVRGVKAMRGTMMGNACDAKELRKTPQPEPLKYRCCLCGGEFVSGWDDKEAVAELDENFPGFSVQHSEIVCDDCYRKVMEDEPCH